MIRLSIWPWGKGAKNRKETAREEKVDEGKSRGKAAGRWERRYTSAVPKTILNARLAIWQRADFFEVNISPNKISLPQGQSYM